MDTIVPIISWENRDADDLPSRFILRLSNIDIDTTVASIGAMVSKPTAVLPPYSAEDQTFTARCAAVARDKMQGTRVLVPVAGTSRVSIQDFIRALQKENFDAFAFPWRIGHHNAEQFAGFLASAGVLRPGDWYHVAGMPQNQPFSVLPLGSTLPGTWTSSDEGL